MKTAIQYFLIITLLLVLTVPMQGQDKRQLEENLDDRFSSLVDQGAPGTAICVVKDGEIILNKGYGLANLEHQVSNTANTIFDLASLSKQFTGYAIASLIESGSISAEDDIRKYIPELPDFGSTITIDHLVHHTSGIRDWTSTLPLAGWSFDDIISMDHILRMAYRQEALNFTPGSEYIYSNTGYNLLAELIERVSGTDFPQWMQENVFSPLGMESTFVLADHTEVISERATAYFKKNDEYHLSPNNLMAWGSSSMYSSTTDLSRWVMHLMNPDEANKAIVERMFRPGEFNDGTENSYAYGVGVGKFRGKKAISHSGSWASFSTYLTMIPDSDLAIIVLCNQPNRAYTIAQDISAHFIPELETIKASQPNVDGSLKVTEEVLNRYVGTYKLGPGWYVELTNRNGVLWTQATGENSFPMLARTDTSFVVPGYGMRGMTFYQDVDGEVSGFEYNDMKCPKMPEIEKGGKKMLSELEGEYHSEELGTSYLIKEEEGNLKLVHFRNGEINLTPAFGNEFGTTRWFVKAVEFLEDEDGNVEAFKVYSYRARDQVFKKVD